MTRHYSKAPSNRQLQIGQELRFGLSDYFTKGEFYHPLLEATMITISEVRISADLKHATVFLLLPEDSDKKAVLSLLKEIAPQIRKDIGAKLKLRFTPEFRFILDETQEKVNKIESLFEALHKKN